jgi:hypothetical protein
VVLLNESIGGSMISTDTKPPAWDLSSLYLGLSDPNLESDLENCTKAVESIRAELSETVGTKELHLA